MSRALLLLITTLACVAGGDPVQAQRPTAGEVRQIVSFTLSSGAFGEVESIYRDTLLELYRADPAMRSLRIFREAESPVPVDLVVVRAFDGMSGMDASNAALGGLAAEAGVSMGGVYGRISNLSTGHTDEFVDMLPELGRGDPTAARYTAFVRYDLDAGQQAEFEAAVESELLPIEAEAGVTSASGRLLIGDGWDHLRVLGFESLGAFHEWSEAERATPAWADRILRRRVQILVSISDFDVR